MRYFLVFLIINFIFIGYFNLSVANDVNNLNLAGYTPPKGFVPDETTAIKIAEAIWLPIYGAKIENEKPFKVELKDSTVWIVQGTLKAQKGGVAYIEIQKSDCKILLVKHGK